MRAGASTSEDPGRSCTVSVVSHGQGSLVERLLEDLAALSPPSVAQCLVTRNLPNDPIALPEGLGFPVSFLDNRGPRGFAANHNAAFARCSSPWFAVLNPDLRLSEDPFRPLLAASAAGTALLCPRVLEPDGGEADAARLLPTPARLLRRVLARIGFAPAPGEPGGLEGVQPSPAPEWYAGMFMLLRSEAFRAVGGFDERYFMYCEDVDLCARLRLAGWQLQQVGAASVVHDARRGSRRSPRHLRWHVASMLRLWASPAFSRYRALIADERGAGPGRRMARS